VARGKEKSGARTKNKQKTNKQTKTSPPPPVFPRAAPQSKRLEQAKQRAVQALQHSKKELSFFASGLSEQLSTSICPSEISCLG